MSKREKLIQKIMAGSGVSYNDAETILIHLGFTLEISGSHHLDFAHFGSIDFSLEWFWR